MKKLAVIHYTSEGFHKHTENIEVEEGISVEEVERIVRDNHLLEDTYCIVSELDSKLPDVSQPIIIKNLINKELQVQVRRLVLTYFDSEGKFDSRVKVGVLAGMSYNDIRNHIASRYNSEGKYVLIEDSEESEFKLVVPMLLIP
ncbi:hypothetical protein LIS04_184 [Listeria phage LIS04]|nr:hypothetical protein LIS04_184 [Listeria phage LIS04]